MFVHILVVKITYARVPCKTIVEHVQKLYNIMVHCSKKAIDMKEQLNVEVVMVSIHEHFFAIANAFF